MTIPFIRRICRSVFLPIIGLLIACGVTAAQAQDEKLLRSDLTTLRADLSGVVQAVYYRLTGNLRDALGSVHFAPGIGDIQANDQRDYRNWSLNQVVITKDEAMEAVADHRRLGAVLQLRDPLGRISLVDVAAEYVLGERVVLIQNAVAIPHASRASQPRLLIVPAARLPGMATLKRFPFDEILRLFAENAYSESELAALSPVEKPRLLLGLFDMVRQPDETTIGLFTSSQASTATFQRSDSFRLSEQGWNAHVVAGRFALNSGNSAVLSVVRSDQNRNQRVIARYSLNFR